ncbi:MAG: energy transducer TonB [Candidatus Electrothrix sp. AW5]|nr:energy transducer TonB [Candidatus Electrothrix gigas]
MFPAALLTFALHGALLSWQMQKPQTLRPKPLPQRISVSLERLPPPLPPLKKIEQDIKPLPAITPVQHEALRPLMPQPKPQPKLIKPTLKKIIKAPPKLQPPPKPEPMKKIVQKIPVLPKIPQIKNLPVRRLIRKPGKKISVVSQPLPQIAPVYRQPKELLAPPIQKPVRQPIRQVVRQPVRQVVRQPVRQVVRQPVRQPVMRQVRQQPVVRRTRPIMQPTRPVRQPVRSQRTAPPVHRGMVREAAPLYKTNPPPEYPRMARRRGLQGVVTIEAKVNSRGTVDELRLFSSSGHRVLDKAALRAVRAWRFSPGTVGGRAQSMWVKVPVRFTLR